MKGDTNMILRCVYCGIEIILNKFNLHKKYCSKKCHRAHYYFLNKKREKMMSQKWYQKNRESEIAKNKEYRKQNRELFNWYHNKERFNGIKEQILKRDNYKCMVCNSINVMVHHIDGNNFQKEIPNHNIDNLITLCRSCHSSLHHQQRRDGKIWSREDIVQSLAKVKEIFRKKYPLRKKLK